MLRADELYKSYPTRGEPLVVLRGVSLRVESGESLAVTGPSGSGKSTLLNVLGTLEPPSGGEVEIAGVRPLVLPERELAAFRNRRIGFVFQEHHLLPQCTALENVLLPSLVGEVDRLERARRLLERVGLSDRMQYTPAELSGGERQRVAIARALVNEPWLVLADEPTGNLDRATADAVAELLAELQAAEGFGLIVVTHSERLAGRLARRAELVEGRLVEPGRLG